MPEPWRHECVIMGAYVRWRHRLHKVSIGPARWRHARPDQSRLYLFTLTWLTERSTCHVHHNYIFFRRNPFFKILWLVRGIYCCNPFGGFLTWRDRPTCCKSTAISVNFPHIVTKVRTATLDWSSMQISHWQATYSITLYYNESPFSWASLDE